MRYRKTVPKYVVIKNDPNPFLRLCFIGSHMDCHRFITERIKASPEAIEWTRYKIVQVNITVPVWETQKRKR